MLLGHFETELIRCEQRANSQRSRSRHAHTHWRARTFSHAIRNQKGGETTLATRVYVNFAARFVSCGNDHQADQWAANKLKE